MAPKCGRPISLDTDDPVILRRRQRDAERARQSHYRRKAAREATIAVTLEQFQQSQAIVDVPFIEEDATPTLPQLGIRVSEDILLGQDAENASLQCDAVDVEEHDALYQDQEEEQRQHDQQLNQQLNQQHDQQLDQQHDQLLDQQHDQLLDQQHG